LPTPLSVKHFTLNSASADTREELERHISEQSKKTEDRFAYEIEQMPADKQLFLAFPLLSNNFDVEWVRTTYEEIVNSLPFRDLVSGEHPWSFDRVLDWFRSDKIELVKAGRSKNVVIRFSHPSYLLALSQLEQTKQFQQILSMLAKPIIIKFISTPQPHSYLETLIDNFDRRWIEQALNKMGEQLYSLLAEFLYDEDPNIRSFAVSNLRTIGALQTAEPILPMLNDNDPHVRSIVASTLGIIGDSSALEPLINTLNDKESSVRAAAATALGYLHHPRSVQHLINLLNNINETSSVRVSAVEALGRRDDKVAISALRNALHDRDPYVRRAAGNTLKLIRYWEDRLFLGLNSE
jgi:hypothetical protein